MPGKGGDKGEERRDGDKGKRLEKGAKEAAVRALKQAKEIGAENVTLYTDSSFLVKAITEWIHGWKKNGWKLATGETVKNKEDFEALEQAKEGLKVNWVHVRGHQGIHGNEQADRLAVQALNKPL